MDDRLAIKFAASFARTTGIEFEDLLQEAREAYQKADRSYDPHHSAFVTFATHCIYRHLCGVAEVEKRKHPQHEAMSDHAFVDGSPSPEDRTIFLDLLRHLPDDARTVVSIVLGDAPALAGLSPQRARRALRASLSGWSPARVREAFGAVSDMLRTEAV